MSSADLLGEFRWADDGATDTSIRAAQAELAATFPTDYAAVLRTHDGGHGWVGQVAYLQLWSIEEIVEGNMTLEVREFAPGAVLIGTDGGGELYGFRTEDGRAKFYKFPAVGLSLDEAIELGDSWQAFLTSLAENR